MFCIIPMEFGPLPLVLKSSDSRAGFTNTGLVLEELRQDGDGVSHFSEWTEGGYSGFPREISDVTIEMATYSRIWQNNKLPHLTFTFLL